MFTAIVSILLLHKKKIVITITQYLKFYFNIHYHMIVNAIVITFLGGLLTCWWNSFLLKDYPFDLLGLWIIQIISIFIFSLIFSKKIYLVLIWIINYLIAIPLFFLVRYLTYYIFDSIIFPQIVSPMVATLIIYGLLMITSITYMNYQKKKENTSKDAASKNNL